MIKKLTCGRFELRKPGDLCEYWIGGEQVEYQSFDHDAPERIMFEVLTEILDRENEDNGLRWE